MSDSMYTLSVEAFAPTLRALMKILDKAAEHAAHRKFDPAVLLAARLAPDMYPLARQVQIACDFARSGAGRLAGLEPPRMEDREQTLDELKARIAKTLDDLQRLDPGAFAGAADRDVKISLPHNVSLEFKGLAFLRDWALPNFYFHVVTAYDILRHNGVEIGKRDYLARD